MLVELRIADLGVIADATIEPTAGMTAITGETGAGKTMIVSSLGLLLGGRADSSVVRLGSQRAIIEGRFDEISPVIQKLDSIGAQTEADELLVSRQVSKQGRSRVFVGGVQTPISKLAEITGELATIHGQAEQVRLGDPDRQREVLDHAGGPELLGLLERYRQAYRRRDQLRAERDDLIHNAQGRAREADLLHFGLDEISAVDPHPGEDAELAAEASRLQAMDDLRMLAERANHALSGSDEGDLDDPGAIGLVGMARHELVDIARLDEQATELANAVRILAGQVNELAADVASYLADLDADPLRLDAVTSRRAQLAGLTRKYGSTIDEVLAWAEQAASRLGGLTQGDQRLNELNALIADLDETLLASGGQITGLRERAAQRLASAVQTELAALAMPHARLRFELQPLPKPGPHGLEHLQLLFAANPGAAPGPLARVASGGELSRVRLGLEVVLAAEDPGHVFVFDEVDAGIGGTVAIEVGRRLARLAEYSQVIVVTHLAQVAAFASAHWVVSKSSDGQVTTSDLRLVSGVDRQSELARMMGGLDDSSSGLAHARDLLELAGAHSLPAENSQLGA